MTIPFGERLGAALAEHGQLCVGIDPHENLLVQWGLEASAAGAREFGLRVVAAAAGRVAAVKPQVSFFERWGSAGFAALEDVLAAARDAHLIVIADAKRGDIGTTMAAYAEAWLNSGSPLEADALTVSPYLGVGTFRSTFSLAQREGKGVFVLAATSDRDGFAVQSSESIVREAHPDDMTQPRGQSVADAVARAVQTAGADTLPDEDGSLHSFGVVVGATVDREELSMHDRFLRQVPILAPGFGAQGARLPELPRIFGALAPQVLASESRGILSGGPDELISRIDARKALLREAVARG